MLKLGFPYLNFHGGVNSERLEKAKVADFWVYVSADNIRIKLVFGAKWQLTCTTS